MTHERDLARSLRPFEAKSARIAVGQLAASFALYLGSIALLYTGVLHGYWLVLLLAPLAAGSVVRIFALQHDCGHGSLFATRGANDWAGRLCSLVTYTPYRNWRRQHAGHHANWNNLDRRESGVDIYSHCLTVAEYRALSRWGRLAYRLRRHPLLLFGLLPPLVFTVLYRVPFDTPPDWQRERRSVWLTNAVLLVVWGAQALLFDPWIVLAVQGPVIALAAMFGTWLFFVQHQFEDTAWMRGPAWSFTAASLRGSSHLHLPGILRWFTGNIGLHPLHHLNPRIPNYRLRAAEAGSTVLAQSPRLGIATALRASTMALWHEEAGHMVRFRDLATIAR
jgi:omega-6 fatty acid desaturase (delta-12 desaturase)